MSTVRADGRTLSFAYDPQEHQLTTITSPRGLTTLTYQEPTDQLATIVEPAGEQLDFTRQQKRARRCSNAYKRWN